MTCKDLITCSSEEYVVKKLIEEDEELRVLTEEYDSLVVYNNELEDALETVKKMISVTNTPDHIKLGLNVYNTYDKADFERLVRIFGFDFDDKDDEEEGTEQ